MIALVSKHGELFWESEEAKVKGPSESLSRRSGLLTYRMAALKRG